MLKKYLNKLFLLPTLQKYIIAFGCVVCFLIALKLINYSTSNNLSDTSFEDYFNSNYKIFSVRIPQNLNFAGEKVPISDIKIHEVMEQELEISTYSHSQSLMLHKRASQWFPVIEPILKKNNIPDDFKYITLIESQLTNVVSPQGAAGFWQIVESTGKNYGMEITDEVDERYQVIKSTETACRYFNEAYQQFHNWTLVAASYNLGINGIQARMNEQKVNNYYDLNLTDETSEYVFRILAMKEIISRPEVYGFIVRKKDKYYTIPTKLITIDTSINDLSEFAKSQGTNYSVLKFFNPWLKANTLTIKSNEEPIPENQKTVKRKKYIIALPKKKITIYNLDGMDVSDEIIIVKDSVSVQKDK